VAPIRRIEPGHVDHDHGSVERLDPGA